jgi:wyosine [tRNA(Phe)-imidazoG37] synthetase (radical SAM superfamily)
MNTLEPARVVQDPVFGPCESRRFGKSLGVNPLPSGARVCNFDCIYCECPTGSWPTQWDLQPQFPAAEQIRRSLASAAEKIGPEELDTITIAGNGEPTLAPELDAIVDVVTEARDRDWPQARTVILTNGTMCHRRSVRAALAKLDQRIVKLDAGTNWILEQLNRPVGKLSITELLRRISMMPENIIQSMFVHGPVDNTGPHDIQEWCRWLGQLAPLSIQIYSLARTPAKSWVRAVRRDELEAISASVQSSVGIEAHVF